VDRWIAYALLTLAIAFGCAAVVLALAGFVEYLQSGRWPTRSVLELVYEWRLVRARWFLANDWSWPLHDALRATPVIAVVLALAPLCWWLGSLLTRR
jgi:hypothetical protein